MRGFSLTCSLPAQPAEAAEVQVRARLSVENRFGLLAFSSVQPDRDARFQTTTRWCDAVPDLNDRWLIKVLWPSSLPG